jgi:Carboxypeptidase regulatory-like domain/TonB dependent receptor
MRRLISVVGALFLALWAPVLKAQDVSSITGIVTDSTGAVIPGVTVTLLNPATSIAYTGVTNEVGSYTILHVAPGPGYRITYSREGFKPSVITDVYLNVNATRTQNAQMVVGGATATVEVSAAAESVTLNTTDATIGNNYEVQMVNELPIQVRDSPSALFSIQPGATSDGAITGARQDQNNVTLDGLDVNDMATGQFGVVVGNAPVDSVQELRAVTANPTATEGQGGGGQFTMVTKGGTNNWHGALFEYHRDTSTEANNWFANLNGVPRAPLIRNQFGGNVGGPIKRNKAFFFFEYNGRRDNQGVQRENAVPLDSFHNGQISYIKKFDSSGALCGPTSRKDTIPDCIGTIDSAHVAALDPQGIGFDPALLDFVNQRYPQANDPGFGDGINTGGFFFNAPVHRTQNDYVARVDYNLNNAMKLWVRGSVLSSRVGDAVNFDAPIQFPGDPVTHLINDSSWAYVVGHNWTIGANKSNAFYYGVTRSRLNFPVAYNPTGTVQWTNVGGDGSGGAILTSPYASAVNAQVRNYPIPVIRDDFSWLKGKHSFQFGGLFKFIKTYENTYLNYDQPSLGLGGNLTGLNASLRPADIRTAGTIASRTYDSAFSLALGRFSQITSTYDYTNGGEALPQGSGAARQYRYYELEGYVADSWKATPDLTLSLGLRYSWYSVPYEVNGRQSVQSLGFNDYFDQRLQQSAAGASGDGSVPFISYDLGGKANNGPGYYDSNPKDFAPRVAFAYNPAIDKHSVISGGFGIVFDHTVVNAVQYQQDQYSYLFQATANLPFGATGDPVSSLRNDPRFSSITAIPAAPGAPEITHPFVPFVQDGVPFGLQNGQAFNQTIDRHLHTPYSIVIDFGIQHEFPKNYILKLNYAGRLGRRLLAQADANQLIDFPDTHSGQMMSQAFSEIVRQLRDTGTVTPQPWFENVITPGVGEAFGYNNNTELVAYGLDPLPARGDFADTIQAISTLNQFFDSPVFQSNIGMGSQFSENTFYTNKGFSNYQGLLATLHKNLSQGLQFDLNYTYSHSIDNVSLTANQIAFAGYGFICDVVRPTLCVGNSDFDQAHIITGNVLYNLPFGRGRTYGATMPGWANQIVGGWDVSALPSWHSGVAFSTGTSAFVAGYANNAPAILIGNYSDVKPHAHKVDNAVNLFADPDKALNSFEGPIGFEIGSRNNLRGPNYVNFDLGVAKTFPLYGENLKLKFRADAFNAFNHASFSNPTTSNSNITAGSGFGQITSTANTARVLQLALRLEF